MSVSTPRMFWVSRVVRVGNMMRNVGSVRLLALVATIAALISITPRGQLTAQGVIATGVVRAWGNNPSGQLGDGTTISRATPGAVLLPDGAELIDVGVVAAGGSHTVAVGGDGSVWAWGANGVGQLGDGTTTSRSNPVHALTTDGSRLSNIVSVSAGPAHSMALAADGTVWAWGANDSGQLGDGTRGIGRSTAAHVQAPDGSVLTNIVAIAAGASHSVALDAGGTVWTWGSNDHGQLGNGSSTGFETRAVRVEVTPGNPLTSVTSVAGGGFDTVVSRADGSVWAWGDNVEGQLGDGTTTGRPAPVRVVFADGAPLTNVVAVAAANGGLHTLALDGDGTVWTWGYNNDGQIGDGTTNTLRANPVRAQFTETPLPIIAAIAAGDTHSIALGSDGRVWTWGSNSNGQLGDGTTTSRSNPSAVGSGGTPLTALRIAAGGAHSVVTTRQTTTLSVVASTATYGGTSTLQATLISGGSRITGQAIAFSINGAPVGSATTDSAGVATLSASVANLDAATYPSGIRAFFAGNAVLAPSSASADLAVTKVTPTIDLKVTPNPPSFGQAVTLTAFVTRTDAGSGAPTGIVKFFDGGAFLGQSAVTVNGQASFGTATLAAGTHSLRADYSGDLNFQPGAASATVTVTPLSTGPTSASGILNSDVTWTLAGSPYIVSDSVLVSSGVTLTIEPGVVVQFAAGTLLQVNGTLVARGSGTAPIRFTSAQTPVAPGQWGYVLFTDTSTDATVDGTGQYVSGSALEQVVIEGAGAAVGASAWAVQVVDAAPLISGVTIRTSRGTGIQGTFDGNRPPAGLLRIVNSEITGTDAGINLRYPNNKVLLQGNRIHDTAGVGVNLDTYPYGQGQVFGNTISGNRGTGLQASSSYGSLDLAGNTVSGNQRGLQIFEGATIRDNVVQGNAPAGGMWLTGNAVYTVTGNQITGNTMDASAGGVGGGLYVNEGGAVTISHNIISDNTAATSAGGVYLGLYNYSGSFADAVTDNVISGNVAPTRSALEAQLSSYVPYGTVTYTVQRNTVTQNRATNTNAAALWLNVTASPVTLSDNNIFNNATRYALEDGSANTAAPLTAAPNWWGTSDATAIADLIYDFSDDGSRGLVMTGPALASANLAAPMSPPSGLQVVAGVGTLTLQWTANPESDVAGYRVYYGKGQVVDVGLATGKTLVGLPPGPQTATVTAYDADGTGTTKQTDGHESWYAATEAATVGDGGSTPASTTIVVQKTGTGSGTVTSAPAGIACGSDCAQAYDSTANVTLTATADSGSVFSGWSACAGTGSCTVSGSQTVTATFTRTTSSASGGVSGALTSDTTWTLAQSPIQVTGNVLVPAGITLTIEPDVVVQFAAGTLLQVNGTLVARAPAGHDIRLTSAQTPVVAGQWGYVLFTDSSTDATVDAAGNYVSGSLLEHVVIEGAGAPIGASAWAIQLVDAAPLITGATIRNNRGTGVQASFDGNRPPAGLLRIVNSEITGNDAGVNLRYPNNRVLLQSNRIHDNAGAGVVLDTYPYGQGQVFGNTISSNRGTGLQASSSYGSLDLADNTVSGNQRGLTIFEGATLRNNVVQGNAPLGGVSLTGNAVYTVTGNRIVQNASNGQGGGLYVNEGGAVTISHNIISDNTAATSAGGVYLGLYNYSGSFADAVTDNVISGNVAPTRSALEAQLSSYLPYGTVSYTLTGNTITQNRATTAAGSAIGLGVTTSPLTLSNNNIFNNATRYALEYASPNTAATLNAGGNWWGTSDAAAIADLIYDFSDDGSRGVVTTGPALVSANLAAPMSPPSGLTVTAGIASAMLQWAANQEADVAGYRVYYGNGQMIDVGLATSATLPNLVAGPLNATVTAYDSDRVAVPDQTDGHESWYATAEAAIVGDGGTTLPSTTIIVQKAGTGTGIVTSVPTGIACGSDCAQAYDPTANVTLTATADSGSEFSGWSACAGTGPCTVSGAQTVTATFTRTTTAPSGGVSGALTADTTWTFAQSPIHVTGNVLVPAGVTLTIEPQVVVQFAPGTLLQVNGTLVARAPAGNDIRFTSAQTPVAAGQWGYVLFTDTSTDATFDAAGNYVSGSLLIHVVIEGAGAAVGGSAWAMQVVDAAPLISGVTIRTSRGTGIQGTFDGNRPPAGLLRIVDSEITGTDAGINLRYPNNKVLLQGNRIHDTAGVGLNLDTYPYGQGQVFGNTISGNRGTGLQASSSYGSLDLANNTVTGNRRGLQIFEGATIRSNVVQGNAPAGGMWLTGNAVYTVTGNQITGNTMDASAGGVGGGLYVNEGGAVTISHNIISDNTAATSAGGVYLGFYNYSGSFADALTDNVISGNVAPTRSALEAQLSSYLPYGTVSYTLTGNTITQNRATTAAGSAIGLGVTTSPLTLSNNNIFNNATRYALEYASPNTAATLNAGGNWWGTSDAAAIADLIYDFSDDGSRGVVTTAPALADANTAAPVSPPSGLTMTAGVGTATLHWAANPEADVAGYRVYYGSQSGPPYVGGGAAQGQSPIDVGNLTSVTLTNLPLEPLAITVTAYDVNRDGIGDQTDGNESWFAAPQFAAGDTTPPAISLLTPQSGATYAIFQVVVAEYTCSDASGIAACTGAVPNGDPIDTSTPGLHSFLVTARDTFGNISTASVSYTVIDLPTITIVSPTDGIYDRGSVVIAQYSCQNAVTCVGDVPSGSALDTSVPGLKTFSVNATDALGNVTTAFAIYNVSLGACVAPIAGLTAWLPGDGSAADLVSGTAATWTGAEAYAPAEAASGFSFANGSHASLPLDQAGPFTLQAWVRTPQRLDPEFTGVISTGGPGQNDTSLQLELDGNGNYRLNVGDVDVALIGPALDAFQHIAATFDGATVSVYVNGQLVQSNLWTGSPALGFHVLNLGIDRDGAHPFTGTIDEVQVFNRALSDAEVAQTFLAGSFGFCKNHPPVAVIGAALRLVEATGPLGATVTLDGGASTDPDGDVLAYEWAENGATLGGSSSLSATFAIGAHTVTLTVNDGKASSTATVTFTVDDTTAPVVTVPADITVEATSAAGAVVIFPAPTAVDAVDGPTPVSCSAASDSAFALGTTTVTCSSSDSRANGPAQASFHVTVQDTTAPSLTVPGNVVAEATSAAGAIVTFVVEATDSVDGVVPVICSHASGTTFTLGTTSVSCTATDAHGNTTGKLFDVTVQDTTAPSLTVPADITAEATGATGRLVTFTANAIDVVDGATAVSCSPASGSMFPLGATTVTCSSTDAHGNRALSSFGVTIVDTTGPQLFLPGDMVGEAAAPAGTAVAFVAGATDAVTGSAPVTCTPASGSVFPIGTTHVSCTAVDGSGHATTGAFNITVLDSIPPVVQVTSPTTDVALSTATADVIVQTSDAIGVVAVSVNGVAATQLGGTALSGTWRATVPITIPAASGAVMRFDATAADAAGNVSTVALLVDNDGIPKAIDRGRTSGADQSNAFSNDFNNDVTAGTIARNGWTTKLSSVAPAGTVQATISGSAVGPAVISACIGIAKEVRLDVAGETANISCNPATGTITVKAVSAVTRIELREQLAGGTWQQFSLATNQMMSVGSPAIADPANTETIEAQIIQIDAAGNETVVGAYQLTPGASVDVSATTDAAGTVDIQFDVLSGTVTTSVGGETRTVAQGETVTLPVTGPLKATPAITWPAPATIVYGTALGAAQLNAAANVAGTFVYTPAPGTVLSAGVGQMLSVTFTPADTAAYMSATKTVPITVQQATPVITWKAPAAIAAGTPLGTAQLNATANVNGTFVYTPATGAVLPSGTQTLSVEFTPADTVNYTKATATVPITVLASFSVSDISIVEGNSTGATKQALVPVKLAAKSSEWVAITYTTADGSAKRDVDYFAISDTVWFAPGVVSQTVAIPIVQDTVGEATESFFVDFTAVINGAPSQARATITIVNDDSSAQVFTSTADYAAGTPAGSAYLSETDDGEIMLAPQGSEFSGTSLPAGWTSTPLAPGATTVVANGKIAVNGASVVSPFETTAGQTLEFAAIFSLSPDQRVGFAASSAAGSAMAMFVIESDGELYARSVNGAKVVESLMGGIDWLGKPHRYKIVWTTGGAQYYVDNTLMIGHSSMAWGALAMRPSMIDANASDAALQVDWLRATPYGTSGTYTSPVFDAAAAVVWQKLTATSSIPTGTTATLTYRTGDTPVPDGSWKAFTAPGAGGALAGSSRYLQFALQLSTTSATKSPVVQDVTVQFKR